MEAITGLVEVLKQRNEREARLLDEIEGLKAENKRLQMLVDHYRLQHGAEFI